MIERVHTFYISSDLFIFSQCQSSFTLVIWEALDFISFSVDSNLYLKVVVVHKSVVIVTLVITAEMIVRKFVFYGVLLL